MSSHTLKTGLWWLLKAAILFSLSVVAIFLATPHAEAATLITGNLITSGGVPAIKFDDDSIVNFESPVIANQFWGDVGNQVQVDGDIRQSTIFGLRFISVIDGEVIWENLDLAPVGGPVVVEPDRIQGRLIVRRTRPAVDISPEVLYGGYHNIELANITDVVKVDLMQLANTYGADIVAHGKLDGLVIYVDDLWVNGIQRQ